MGPSRRLFYGICEILQFETFLVDFRSFPGAIRLSRPRPEPFPAYAAQLDAVAKAAEELRIPTNFRPLKSPLNCLTGPLVVFLRSDFFS